MTKHLRILAPLLAATALAAVGCGGGSTSTSSSYDGGQAVYSTKAKAATTPAASQGARVAIQESSFQPATIKLHVGDTVSFRNDDEIAHTVTAQDGTFDSGTLQHGAKFTFTAKKIGTIAYVCSFHPAMTGTIEVSN